MVRAPCCQKVGMKRGPWSPEEDQILVDYIRRYGHANWRALPRQAGLLRCGKSCRLRWTNYLRPDIKRGNFTKEEEDMIISLHEKLGNKWSAIAAMIPGRTDNEIKNVWHTHLKKRECPREAERTSKKKKKKAMVTARDAINSQQQPPPPPPPPLDYCPAKDGDDALPSVSTPFSSYPAPGSSDNMGGGEEGSLSEGIDESFWSEALWAGADPTQSIDDIGSVPENSYDLEFWLSMFRDAESMVDLQVVQGLNLDESYVRVHF